MIPVMEIRREEVFLMGYQLGRERPERNVVCHAYLYGLEIKDALAEARTNLDHFLTWHIVGHLYSRMPKSKLMFLFAPLNDGDLLMVCDRRGCVSCDWLAKLPGYQESGRDFISPNSTPFVYWDGERAYRVYNPPGERTPAARYVVDMVPLQGSLVSATDKSTYDAIAADPVRYWDYAAIPDEPEQQIEVRGRRLAVTHAFARFV